MKKLMYSIGLLMVAAINALGGDYFDRAPYDAKFDADKPVVNGATYDDIRQGEAPMCSLMSALSAAARSDIDLGKNIKHLGDNQYSVRLFVKGRWTHVVVRFNGWTKYDPEPNDKGEFWVALYQRAFLTALDVDCSDEDHKKWAVIKDGKRTDRNKDSQPWRSMEVAMRTVTGKTVEVWDVDNASINRIRKCLEQKQCVTIGTVDASIDGKVRVVRNHAYTVLAAGEDWIEVRNPWGSDGVVRVGLENQKIFDVVVTTK